MFWLDCAFSEFRWWRQIRGGNWYRIFVKPVPIIGPLWIDRPPNRSEILLEGEMWGQ